MPDQEALRDELRRLRSRVEEIENQLCDAGEVELDSVLFLSVVKSMCRDMSSYILLYSPDGNFLYCNRTAAGYSEPDLAGTNVFDFTRLEDRDRLRAMFQRIVREGTPQQFTSSDIRFERTYTSHFSPVTIDGRVVAIANFCEDITERTATQKRLEDSEARLRFLISSLPIVYWAVGRDLCFSSSYGLGLTGLNLVQGQVVGQPLHQFLGDSEGARLAVAAHQRALLGETVQYDITWSERRYHSLVSPLRDGRGQVDGVVGVAVDMTDWARQVAEVEAARDELEARVRQRTKQLEDAYRSRTAQHEVMCRLVDLHDRDKRMIGYEIHDGLVQDMTAAQLFFGAVETVIENGDPDVAESYQQGMQLLQKTIREARRIMGGVSPYELEQFGLVPAIEAMAIEIQHRTGIEVRFDQNTTRDRYAPAIDRAAFRIVQESLSNIWKHSGATQASVSIREAGAELHIEVRDWGKGFDPAATPPKRYGLLSMKERASLLGGEAKILSKPGEGTTISVRLPTTDLLLQASADDGALVPRDP